MHGQPKFPIEFSIQLPSEIPDQDGNMHEMNGVILAQNLTRYVLMAALEHAEQQTHLSPDNLKIEHLVVVPYVNHGRTESLAVLAIVAPASQIEIAGAVPTLPSISLPLSRR